MLRDVEYMLVKNNRIRYRPLAHRVVLILDERDFHVIGFEYRFKIAGFKNLHIVLPVFDESPIEQRPRNLRPARRGLRQRISSLDHNLVNHAQVGSAELL